MTNIVEPNSGLSPIEIARIERDEAMAAVAAHDRAESYALKVRAVTLLAESHAPFSSDTVWEVMGIGKGGGDRALGPIIKRMADTGRIEQVGWIPSVRRHCAPLALWQGT